MKYEINLPQVSPKKNRQKIILSKFLQDAKEYEKLGLFVAMMRSLEQYTSYSNTLIGKNHRRIVLDTLKVNGTDQLAKKRSNKYLDMARRLYEVSANHKPSQQALGQWIGVEIECFIPCQDTQDTNDAPEYDDDGDLIEYDSDIDDSSATRARLIGQIETRKIKYVDIKRDGSIRADKNCIAVEFTILTKIDDLSNLEKLCKLLHDVNAKVNASCGLHIHLDQRDVNTRNSRKTELSKRLTRLNQCLPLLETIVPKSRRDNNYCRVVKSTLKDSDRYKAINTTALSKFGTLEIRLHSATTDFLKISNWIKLLYGISRCENIKSTAKYNVSTIEKLYTFMPEMSLEMFMYFKGRIDKFAANTPVAAEIQETNDYTNDNSMIGELIPTEINTTIIVPF
jgi:hypothetical protein